MNDTSRDMAMIHPDETEALHNGVQRLAWLLLAVSTGLLSLMVAINGPALGALIPLALAGLWAAAVRFQPGWVGYAATLLTLSLVGAVFFNLLPAFLAVICLAALLSAWDLAAFAARLESVGLVIHSQHVVRAHLLRLAWVNLAGLILAALALLLRINLGFTTALILALLIAVAASYAVRAIRHQS